MVEFAVVPDRAALLTIDLQNCFVSSAREGETVLGRVNRVAAACREADILVVHVSHVLRPDGSDAGLLGEFLPWIRRGGLNAGRETAALHDQLEVDERDVQLQKPRFGAFHGTGLEELLRGRGIDTVIIGGIATDVCCDTTAREAHARDFRVLFLSDATTTTGRHAGEAQARTLDLMAALFAQVLSVEDLLAKIGGARAEAVTNADRR